MGRTTFRLISSICVMLLVTQVAYGARFFCYVDDDGKLVLSHTIPNERVKLGYDIVDENARVMQRIAPQLSKDEYERRVAEQAACNECLAALKGVRSLYRSVDDINYAEQQALESIETQITNTKANLTNQRKELEEQAAQLDIVGRQIPNSLLENIASAKTQEGNLEEQIKNRYGEKLEERLAYNLDLKVFGRDDCESGSAEQSG